MTCFRLMSVAKALVFFAAAFLYDCEYAQAREDYGGFVPYQKSYFSIISENDAFFDSLTDKYYSAGSRFAFTSKEYDLEGEEGEKHSFLSKLAKVSFIRDRKFSRWSLRLGQEIYTPKEKTSHPDLNKDHPYAGYLYLSFGMTNRTPNAEEQVWLNVGVVGPWSLAKEMQDFFHLILNNNQRLPGWDSQVDNEPILNFHYQITGRRYLFDTRFVSSDVLLTGDAAIGNADIHAGSSLRLRVGYGLNADFGVPKINLSYNAAPPHSDAFGVYFFAGAGGRIIGKNIVLGGNTFSSGTGIDLYPFVYDFEAGGAIFFKGFRVSYVWSYRSLEFRTQDTGTNVGSILIDIAF